MSASALSAEASRIARELDLSPHPEGGFYREIFRSPEVVPTPRGPRSASTAIYFLLPAGELSALHRVASDEAWHHYAGGPVELHLIDGRAGTGGQYRVVRLGADLAAGERPMYVVPAGVWQAAIAVGSAPSLCGCTVAPGFHFADFELPPRAALLALFPSLADEIRRLTR